MPLLRLEFQKSYAQVDERDAVVGRAEQCLRLDSIGWPSRAAVPEDIPVAEAVWEGEHRCSCNREEAVGEEHHIRSSDNSNHNTAACNGFGVQDCMDVRDAEAEEVVVHGEESRDQDGGRVGEEDTRAQVSTKRMVDRPSSLGVSSLHAVH